MGKLRLETGRSQQTQSPCSLSPSLHNFFFSVMDFQCSSLSCGGHAGAADTQSQHTFGLRLGFPALDSVPPSGSLPILASVGRESLTAQLERFRPFWRVGPHLVPDPIGSADTQRALPTHQAFREGPERVSRGLKLCWDIAHSPAWFCRIPESLMSLCLSLCCPKGQAHSETLGS